MKMEGDVMKMLSLENGLIIHAGGEIHLKPGGYHLMFIRLKQKMTAMLKPKLKVKGTQLKKELQV